MSDDSFFDDDDDGDANDTAATNTTNSAHSKSPINSTAKRKLPENDADEVDPLDAFMATLADEPQRCSSGPGSSSRVRRDDIEEKDVLESFLEHHAVAKKQRTAANDVGDAAGDDDAVEPSSYVREKTLIETLPARDHSRVPYIAVRKAFYATEHADVAARSFADIERERRELQILVTGGDVKARALRPIGKFEHVPLDARLAAVLAERGFSAPLPIQREALPVAMAGYDLIALAQTGSGKTAAYLLPMFTHILDQPPLGRDETGPIGLILAPTHELAQQIHAVACELLSVIVNRVSKQRETLLRGLAVTGGAQMYEQKQTLKRGVEYAVATPGRMIDMIKSGACACERISFLVLDEADRMFAMGFEPQIRSIVGQIRPDRQTLLFSATFKKKLESLASDILLSPVRISIGHKDGQANERIVQIVEVVDTPEQKYAWLVRNLPRLVADGAVLVFVSQKKDAARLADDLKRNRFRADCLHGDMTGPARTDSLNRFRAGRFDVLVATDVAARGLDLPDVRTVVCFDAASDIHAHTHRIGRTGRGDGAAALLGQAYTILSRADADFAAVLVESLDIANQEVSVPLMQLATHAKRPPRPQRPSQQHHHHHHHQQQQQGQARSAPQQAYNPFAGSD
jgi:ATP-dependent RNA helicase DDX42